MPKISSTNLRLLKISEVLLVTTESKEIRVDLRLLFLKL